jgi:hypothetical protein
MYVTYQTVLNYFFKAMVFCNEEKVGKEIAESLFGVKKL